MTMMRPVETTPTTTGTILTRDAVWRRSIIHVQHTQSDMLHIHGDWGVVVGGIPSDSVLTEAIRDDPEKEDSSTSYNKIQRWCGGHHKCYEKTCSNSSQLYFVKYRLDRLMLAGNIGIVNPSITNAAHYPDTVTSVMLWTQLLYAATQVYAVPVWWTEDTDEVAEGRRLCIWLICKLLGYLYATMSSILDSSISSYTVTLYSPAGRSTSDVNRSFTHITFMSL